MKTVLINDVPTNIKTLGFYGDADIKRIEKLEKDIDDLKKEIYKIYDLPVKSETQDKLLVELIKQVTEKQNELNLLKKIQNPSEKKSNNIFLFGLFTIGILLFLNRKKR